jgi:hypothetical protein
MSAVAEAQTSLTTKQFTLVLKIPVHEYGNVTTYRLGVPLTLDLAQVPEAPTPDAIVQGKISGARLGSHETPVSIDYTLPLSTLLEAEEGSTITVKAPLVRLVARSAQQSPNIVVHVPEPVVNVEIINQSPERDRQGRVKGGTIKDSVGA